ncbi:MAG: alpha-amylase family glycosyl hydrolase, partial [Candidatus Cloacimonadaceae bacterium]|nr:alpha-amylase family glycosyl hydrolase [Candidatus Cloacimonadaceae bacterium]
QAMMNLYGSHDTWRIIELADDDIQRLKIAILFQMCFVGTPHIYYGDEIAMRGTKDPDNRRPFNWNWSSREEAVELHGCYRELIAIRMKYKVLREGSIAFIDSPVGLCHYARYDVDYQIHILINMHDKAIHVPEIDWYDAHGHKSDGFARKVLYSTSPKDENFLMPYSGIAVLLQKNNSHTCNNDKSID